MERDKLTQEFKVEVMKLTQECGVTVAQAAQDFGVSGRVLRRWVWAPAADASQAFLTKGR